jgi:hypothetical protein
LGGWLVFFADRSQTTVSVKNIAEYCALEKKLASETARADTQTKVSVDLSEQMCNLEKRLAAEQARVKILEASRLSPADVEAIRTSLKEAGCANPQHQWELDLARKHVCATAPVVASPVSNELVTLRATCANQQLLLERARKDVDAYRLDATAWRGHRCAGSSTTTVVVPGVDLTSPPSSGGCNNIRAHTPVNGPIVDFDRHFVDDNFGDAVAALQKILRDARKRDLHGKYCIDFLLK